MIQKQEKGHGQQGKKHWKYQKRHFLHGEAYDRK
jgi:hypothetical protein